MNIREEARQMKIESAHLAATTLEERNRALTQIAAALQEHADEIFAANEKDLSAAVEEGISQAVLKRLKFDEGKLRDVVAGIHQLIGLEDPLGKTLLHRELDAGLELYRVSVPLGVIGVIFEARPDALVQISTLCLKSGNCAILKGGKETTFTNRVLFDIIYQAAVAAGLPDKCLLQAEAHSEIDELLECHQYVDLLIPRGSNSFVQYIMNHTKIPVMGHADGVCHIYVDCAADLEKALPILIDAKTQYTAACNAVETLLIHRDIASDFLPILSEKMAEAGVRLRGSKEAVELMTSCKEPNGGLESGVAPNGQLEADVMSDEQLEADVMSDEDFHTEYLDLIASVKIVSSVEEAVEHINTYGSHHTDCILTEDKKAADYFMQMVDSAGVYQNCSTRFADGFRYGFGAEVGISTSKLHARGPVGLDGLVTYKYKLYGSGQIVGDYASGKSQFHFKEL